MNARRQRGVVLIVALLFLVILTTLAISAVNTGTINLRIVNNQQSKMRVESIAQQALEQVLSDNTRFDAAVANTANMTIDGVTVSITGPVCVSRDIATGYSATWNLSPIDTEWQFSATATDDVTGAQATVVQGVQLRLAAGACQ